MAMSSAKSVNPKTRTANQEQVKLFVTSYTDEFYAERDIIRKEVLPAVRLWCESKQLKLVENFVKWGGRHPEQRNVAELERLQTGIETSYFTGVLPIFINITSSSIGWPPTWNDYSEEIVEDYQETYGLLCEDLEILGGAFKEDNSNVMLLMRDDSFFSNLSDDERSCFIKDTPESQKVTGDNDKIGRKFAPYQVFSYGVEFLGVDHKRRPLLKFSEELKLKIINFLRQRIALDYCGEVEAQLGHPDDHIKQAHADFLNSKGSFVLGRDSIVSKIENYIKHEERDVPLLVLGESGTGKTSLLCLAAKNVLRKIEKKELPLPMEHFEKWRVFYHFVGAVPGSTSLEHMLKRLLWEAGMTKKSSMCAKDLDSAAQMCFSMLSNLNTEPLIIFLDATNQFMKDHGTRIISWVPRKLAPQVKLIVSMVTDTDVHKALLSRETKPLEVRVTPLTNSSKQGIVEEIVHKGSDVRLTSTLMNSLLDKPSSENPLWLTLACYELRLTSDCDMAEKIHNLPDSLLLLFDELLQRLESGEEGDLLVGTLCMLEVSAAGLNEMELRQLLADDSAIKPPSPFQEKEEVEESEKDNKKEKALLSEERWQNVYKTLQPFLRPYGDSKAGRLDFYHQALSKAVEKRYLTETSDEKSGKKEKSGTYFFWHLKLAELFRDHHDSLRMVEEYPHHLACLDDKFHLAQCLCDWKVFDRLYHEEYSSQLMAYWRKVGPISQMISSYEAALKKFEEDNSANEAAVSLRYEKVCRVTIQAGKHQDALEILKTALKIEEKELGARPHRMVELYALMSEIYDEKLKLNDFVSRSQLPDLRKTIHYAKKSISVRKTLPGSYHKFKLGMSLMRLAFNMKSWNACGGGPELSEDTAVDEGNKYIDRALKMFIELKDMGHFAEALMTKGVLAKRGSMEQLKLYNQAMELCMQMYGELHILTSRLYINIGIVYEDNKDYKRSYQYFKKWARLSEEIMGPDHPKTLRAKGVLRESRYRRIAIELGEWVEDDDHYQEDDKEEERTESGEMEHNYDDTVNNILIVSQDESTLEASLNTGSQDSASASSGNQQARVLPSPSYNIVPLLPNPYLETCINSESSGQTSDTSSSERQRNQPRDTYSYLRSRLERGNAIRRGVPISAYSNPRVSTSHVDSASNVETLSPSRTLPDIPQDRNLSAAESVRQDLTYNFDSLLRELNMNSSSVFSSNPGLSMESPNYVNEDSVRMVSGLQPWEQSSNNRSNAGIASDHRSDSMLRENDPLSRFVMQTENQFHSDMTSNSSNDNLRQMFANGYVPSDEENDNEGSDSDNEGHSDSENFYDDNFEDYNEHYIIAGNPNVADEVAEDEEEILDFEITEESDNRFAPPDAVLDNRFASDNEEDNCSENQDRERGDES